MNGFDLDRKPPQPASSTLTRQPDKPRAGGERDNKMQTGSDQEGRGADFSTLRMRAQNENKPSAATGQQAIQATGAPGSAAAPVAAAKPKAAADTWSETIDRFGHNRSDLTAKHGKSLDALATTIATRLTLAPHSRAIVSVSGHTDTSGDETRNEVLGQKRADAAKAALELSLRKFKLGADRIAPIVAGSLGETNPAVASGDGVKEAANRRVEITITLEGPAPAASATPTQAPPVQTQKKNPVDLNLPPDYAPRLPGPRRPDDWWKNAEENQRKIDKFDREHQRKPRSLNDVLVDGVTKVLEPIIEKLPKVLQDKARDGIRAGIEKGTEAGCDAAIDASGVSGGEAEAIKAACHAALKTKPGEKP